MLEEQLNVSLGSGANVSNRSARNSSNGIECGTAGRENSTPSEDESESITNVPSVMVQINELRDDGFEIELIDDEFAAQNSAKSNVNSYEIESDTISTRSTSDDHNSNDG